jgi:zinc/manganese transport system permease protein
MTPTPSRASGEAVYDLLVAPFAEFAFMRRALVGTVAIALGGGPVGVFLMLRRMSLTGDAMAHAILPGAAVGYLFAGLSLTAMTIGGLVAGVIVAMLAGLVARMTALKEDASLAAFYLLSLALGVTIVSLKGSNVDLLHVLFGTVLALDDAALLLLAGIATVTLATLAVLYRPLVLECVDPVFLRSVSRAGTPAHLIFLGLVVLNLVGGFQALGTLLAVGMMMLPAAASRFWSADVTAMVVVATGIGVLSGVAGLLLSFHAELPAGPAIILTAGIIYLGSLLAGREGGLIWLALPGRHLEA